MCPQDPSVELYDLLYRLYEEFETDRLRSNQEFVDLFPPVDSPVALEQWQRTSDELESLKEEIRSAFPAVGDTFATLAGLTTREQAFTALDLLNKHGRSVNVLVLDVDETLRSAGRTDNEIPRETLHLLGRFHQADVPIVICTGQTLENVKGFLIQGLGNELVYSGDVTIVYEAGTGVFTPGHGDDTKKLLYENLEAGTRNIFDAVRSRVLSDAPERLRRGCHLQGNEFNVTLKPNFETGSEQARDVIEEALVYMLDLLGDAVVSELHGHDGGHDDTPRAWARRYYGDADPEIRAVLERTDASEDLTAAPPEAVEDVFDRIDVAYYEADAAEIGSLELNKAAGVESAFEVLDITDPFALVMGDSKSDLRVMRWIDDRDAGIAAAPDHASEEVLEHVRATDDLVYDRGDAAGMLRTVFALGQLDRI